MAARKKGGSGPSFSRHVAPFAPVALALAMNAAHPGQQANQPQQQQAIVQKGSFTPVCSLPFPGVRNPAADDHCGLQGGSSDPAKQAESRSKNDFCEATHASEVVSYPELVNLQSQSSNIPKSIPDRKVVESLGEGKYVSYIAFVKDAHYSDVTAGEAVNCNIAGNDTNDIHIVLMPNATDTDECDSTTAEMSPHYRPAAWTPDNIMKASAGHPIRVQGHLFYDGSHTPCTASSRPNPKRKSLWEVHPVYSFDVCSGSTIQECQSSSAEWTPLEKVFASESSE
jgi:hypothetical protein